MNSIEHLQNLPVFLPLPFFPPLQIHSSIFPCHCHQAALQFSASNATNPIIPFFYSFEYQTHPHPLSSIILLNSPKPLNQPSLTRRQNKILQSLSEFLRPLPCRINIRNSDSPIAVAQTLIIFPGTQIALYRINNITRKNIWRTNNLQNLIANFRHQKISLLKPNQPLNIRPRIRTPPPFLGVKCCARCVPSMFRIVLSIHPKHSASSTASLYESPSSPAPFIGNTNQTSFAVL